MTCREFSDSIPAFMNDLLDNAALRSFLAHYQECASCREELDIQYLIGKAFHETRISEDVDRSRDLRAYIEMERRRLKLRLRVARTAAVLEAAAVILFAVTAALYFA
ncbi:MAG: zf-HC2 domain-containing protein [Eubacteriales bacterium]|nr:zf-HC2 domain-containing protein [Eubacteriales bacterium]